MEQALSFVKRRIVFSFQCALRSRGDGEPCAKTAPTPGVRPLYAEPVRLLPYERLTLRAESSVDAVEAKLGTLIATGFSFSPPREPFRGTHRRRHFKVVRVLGRFLGLPTGNAWRPVIIGEVVPVPGGTEVRVRLRLSALAGACTALWFGMLVWFFGSMALAGLRAGFGATTREGLLVGFGMLLAGYSLVSISFWMEVKKARRALAEGLGCREVESSNRLIRG